MDSAARACDVLGRRWRMVDTTDQESLTGLLARAAELVEADLARWCVGPDTPARLAEAMRYCALGGGKRLRPALVYMSAEAVGGDREGEAVRRCAVAVELVHGYSMVHDDLPAMDDDTLRRGRATAHVKFGEAMAILAGDALLTRAFAVLAAQDGPQAGPLAAELARGAGPAGMIAGQVADMGLCRVPPGLDGLRYIHQRKTGALIRAAVRMGAICARAEPAQLEAVSNYADALGMTYQVIDDVLDVVGSVEDLGKTPGKDEAAGKRTYVAELGIDGARALAAELVEEAAAALAPLGDRAGDLVQLAHLLAGRTR